MYFFQFVHKRNVAKQRQKATDAYGRQRYWLVIRSWINDSVCFFIARCSHTKLVWICRRCYLFCFSSEICLLLQNVLQCRSLLEYFRWVRQSHANSSIEIYKRNLSFSTFFGQLHICFIFSFGVLFNYDSNLNKCWSHGNCLFIKCFSLAWFKWYFCFLVFWLVISLHIAAQTNRCTNNSAYIFWAEFCLNKRNALFSFDSF